MKATERLMKEIKCQICGVFMGTCSEGWTGSGICSNCCPCCMRPKKQSVNAYDGLVAALRKLARLGNGNQLGNSDGNIIAQKALAKAGETV